jgi:hypothetical protein
MLTTQTSDSTLYPKRENAFIPDKEPRTGIDSSVLPPGPLERKKIVIVGDGAIGKTCFLAYYSQRKFLDVFMVDVGICSHCV